jgi:nucleotide-binding universal stress UspA family protein
VLPPPLSGNATPLVPADFLEHSVDNAKQRLGEVIQEQSDVPLALWKVSASFGLPTPLILEAARQHHADLIAVGSHGPHGLVQLALGSVSESLLGRAHCPVLIAGPECKAPTEPWKNILFATDLEHTDLDAARYAAALAIAIDGRLFLLHVSADKPPAEYRMREWTEDGIRQRLNRLFDVQTLPQFRHEALVAYGNPAEEILATAGSTHADVIVLGTGRHGLVSDHASWSTVSQVVRFARCPVLNVRAK